MKLILVLLAMNLVPGYSYSSDSLRCENEVRNAIEGKEQFNVVEQVHSTDGINYVVIFRTASGDAEQASMAIVTVDAKKCSIKKINYVRGAH